MYKWTLHYPKGETGELMPPAVGYALHSVVVLTATTLVAIWQQEGRVEAEWGGQAWRYAPEYQRIESEPE